MMIQKNDRLTARTAKLCRHALTRMQLLLQPYRNRLAELAKAPRRVRQECLQDPVEFGQWLFIKDNIVQVVAVQTGLCQAISNRPARKARVMLHAAKSLFLSRGDDFSIDYERRPAVVIESRNAQNRGHLARTAGASPWAQP